MPEELFPPIAATHLVSLASSAPRSQAMKAYEDHCKQNGKPESHALAKGPSSLLSARPTPSLFLAQISHRASVMSQSSLPDSSQPRSTSEIRCSWPPAACSLKKPDTSSRPYPSRPSSRLCETKGLDFVRLLFLAPLTRAHPATSLLRPLASTSGRQGEGRVISSSVRHHLPLRILYLTYSSIICIG